MADHMSQVKTPHIEPSGCMMRTLSNRCIVHSYRLLTMADMGILSRLAKSTEHPSTDHQTCIHVFGISLVKRPPVVAYFCFSQ